MIRASLENVGDQSFSSARGNSDSSYFLVGQPISRLQGFLGFSILEAINIAPAETSQRRIHESFRDRKHKGLIGFCCLIY